MKKNKTNDKIKKASIGKDLNFASREAYNLLRTNVTFAFPEHEGGSVIGVTSSCPHEGKSTTSVNLAYSMAEAGYKVLIIDGDMRCPTIHDIMGAVQAPGLSEILAGQKNDGASKGVLHEKLDLIPSGTIPPNPSELISSQKMTQVMEKLRAEYDYIIVDLPPVLSVSDPIAISKNIDGMIIVVRHSVARKRDISETIRQFEQANVKVLGFVYNKIGVSNSKKNASKSYRLESK